MSRVVLPLLSFALSILHPEDPSIAMTMMDVMAKVARGVGSRSVDETVNGIVVPLFRAYKEAVDSFHKSASVPFPRLATVWDREKAAPTVLAFLSLVGQAEAGHSSPGQGGGVDAAALERVEKKLEKKLEQMQKEHRKQLHALSDAEDSDDGRGGKSPRAKKHERQKKARDDRKQQDKAAAAAKDAAEKKE